MPSNNGKFVVGLAAPAKSNLPKIVENSKLLLIKTRHETDIVKAYHSEGACFRAPTLKLRRQRKAKKQTLK